MLSGIRQTRKDKHCKIPLHEAFKTVKFVRIEERWLPGAGGDWGDYHPVGTVLRLGKVKSFGGE